jgi:hypothetical protein
MSSTTAAPQTPAHRHGCSATTAADSRSDRPMQRSATHSNTATQQHSNTATQLHSTQQHSNAAMHAHYQRTAAHGNQQCTHRNPTAPQLHTPQHFTPNMLVSTVVTHNGSAASQTRPLLQAAASSAHTQHLHHSVAVAVGSYSTAVELCNYGATNSNTRRPNTTKRWNACARATEAPKRSAQTRSIEPSQWKVTLRSTWGERGAASQSEQKRTIAALRSHHCRLTRTQHAHSASVLTVYLHCTTQQPLYATHKHSHRCA